jgi:HD-GYP domain-containing protein (c-di-GMP phosphodiesterase class II)
MGQPMEQALRTCLLAVGLGRRLGLSEAQLSEVYYVVLLRFLGCTADAYELAQHVGGDDRFYRAGLAPVLGAPVREFMPVALRHVRPQRIPAFLAGGAGPFRQGIIAHCELAENLAGRLGLSEPIRHAMGQSFESWNGRGLPGKAAGDQIALSARIAFIARDAEVLHRTSGIESAVDTISRRRRAGSYDPTLVDLFVTSGPELLGELATTASPWDAALAAEPEPRPWIPESLLEQVLEVFADFVDMKAPHLLGHSRGVATLASRAAGTDRPAVRRAGLVHDLGRVAVPNGTWDKAASLTGGEREQVRLHPYYSERIVSRCSALASLAEPVGRHHEHLDGSGYHRGCRAAELSKSARVLAVADAFQAMTSDRPWRPALTRDTAAAELVKAVSAGELDREAVDAVLDAAGQPRVAARVKWPAEMSDREVEVLRLICLGQSKKDVGRALGISPSTADHHVRHIYEKIGVSTRAGAAVFALQHDLLP